MVVGAVLHFVGIGMSGIAEVMHNPGLDSQALENAAAGAKGGGRPDAVRDLADLVEGLGS